jgi:hypothetical protein
LGHALSVIGHAFGLGPRKFLFDHMRQSVVIIVVLKDLDQFGV